MNWFAKGHDSAESIQVDDSECGDEWGPVLALEDFPHLDCSLTGGGDPAEVCDTHVQPSEPSSCTDLAAVCDAHVQPQLHAMLESGVPL